MNEDYVSYEQASQLKQLGFDWECSFHYDSLELNHPLNKTLDRVHYGKSTFFKAPPLSQAQKWLREKNDIKIFINVKFHKGQVKYVWYIVTDNGERGICDDPEKSIFDTYELALSAGIDKALQTLNNYE